MPHTHPVVDDDLHFVINPSTREITNESKKIKLMQGDHASEIFTFEIPRYIEGHDMSLCNKIAVHYINIGSSGSNADVYIVTDAAINESEDKIEFSWIIYRTATKYAGNLNFLIKFSCTDDDATIVYQWNTDIFKGIMISTGMDNEETIVEDNIDLLEQWKNEIIENKVDKDEIFNAGIRSISYVPLFGGSFTVTTVEEEGYIKPHAIATVTGRISKHYTYRITVNEEEYVLPCCLFSTRDSSGKVVEYLGNIELYTSDISGLMQDAIHNVPFCIISDLDGKKSIDVFTRSPCEVSITVEQMQKEQTPLPKSLIWGDDYCPIELKKYENSTFNGVSIGCNILKNSRGTFAIGYGNEVSDEFGIAIGYGNTAIGAYSHAEGTSTTSSGTYSHAEGYYTKATETGSHSEGVATTASGRSSHAEGFATTASGQYSHAEGAATTAIGAYSHAEGGSSNAIGPCSHAEGQATKANGAISHSGGNNSITDGRASFAHGNFSKATQPAQFAVGYGNDPQEDSIFEVGNGLNADGAPNNAGNTEPVTRQNAFRVTQSGVAIAQTGLQIGNTVISEDQLKKILAFRVESLDAENPVQLRDLETGLYVLYGYFSPYTNSNISMSFDNTMVVVSKETAGSHLLVFTGTNSKVNFLEIMVDSKAEAGYTYTRTDFVMLDMHNLIAKVGELADLKTTNKSSIVAAVNEIMETYTTNERFNELKDDLDELQNDDGIDYKQISPELTQTKTVLEDTSSNGSCYISGDIIKSNSVEGYKKMILSVAELPSIGTLIIPFDGITNFAIFAGSVGNWSDNPSIIQSYTNSDLIKNGNIPTAQLGWNFTKGNNYASLDCATMKSKIDSRPAFYFYIKNDSNQWFVPFVLQNGTKKLLNWLEITEENLDVGLSEKVNREIPSIEFLFKLPLSFYPRKILCIGDSLTQGHIAGYSPAHFEEGVNYPAYFSRMTGAECTNAGVSGITPKGWYENQFSKYDYTEYDTVFLFLGTNGGLPDTISGANTNDQTGYYCSIIEGIQNASQNTKIVLFGNVEPFYSNVISKIASYYSLPYLDIYGQIYYGIRRRGPSASELVEPTIYHPATNDWVHFSRIGYCVLAQVVYLLLGEKILEMPEYFDGDYY